MLINDVIDRVIPVFVDWRVGKDKVFGFFGQTLQNCIKRNCLFDSDYNVIVNDDIYAVNSSLEPYTFNKAYISGLATKRDGYLMFDNKLIPEDYEEGGELSWRWLSSGSIELLNGSWGNDITKWKFTFEKLTEVETPIIDLGSFNTFDNFVIDGFVYYMRTYKEKEKLITNRLFVVNEDGEINLDFPVIFDKGIKIKDLNGKLIYNFTVDETNNIIQLDDKKYDVVYLDFWSNYVDFVDDDWEVWCRSSNNYSTIGNIEWTKVKFGTLLEQNRYWQIKIKMYGNKPKGFYRIKSLLIRKYNLWR